MEVEHKGELMGLLADLILPSFRESPFADFQHCPSTRDALAEVQSSVLGKDVFCGAKGKGHMSNSSQFWLCPSLANSPQKVHPCETGKEGCPRTHPLLPAGPHSGHGQFK